MIKRLSRVDEWGDYHSPNVCFGKDAGSPPPAPDPNVVSAAQTQSNVDTASAQAALNNTNQVTPFGNLTYSQTGSYTTPGGQTIPTYTATTTLTPEEQKALDSEQQLTSGLYGLGNDQLSRIASNVSTPFDLNQFGQAPAANPDVLNQNIDAVYNQAKSRLDPQFQQQQEQLDTQLRNQGFTPGTTGYDNAMKDFNLAKNDAYTSAMNSAQAAGQTAEANQYNLESASYNDAISKALMQRELPLNEASALISGGQLSTPSFTATPQTGVSPTDVTGAFGLTQSALNNAYQANVASANAGNTAAAGLAGTALVGGAMIAV